MLRVRVDYGAPIAAYALDAGGRTPETSRVPVPSGRPGPHVLTFEDGTADFDLLIRTTPNTATVTLEPAEVVAGGRLRFAGRHFPAGATVHVKLDATGDPMPVTASPRGTISGSVAIPTDTSVGRHELRFLASDPPTSTAVTITVR